MFCQRIYYPKYHTRRRFILNTNRLLKSVVDVCKITAKNSSSMRQDVRNLRNTEIQNLNGYISFWDAN